MVKNMMRISYVQEAVDTMPEILHTFHELETAPQNTRKTARHLLDKTRTCRINNVVNRLTISRQLILSCLDVLELVFVPTIKLHILHCRKYRCLSAGGYPTGRPGRGTHVGRVRFGQ